MEYHRARIRFLLGFREATLADRAAATSWLTEQAGNFDRHTERMTEALLERYRSQKIEPLAPDVIERMVHSALQAYDSNLYETVWQRTSLGARARLMALLLPARVAPEPEAEWVPAVLQELRADAGPVSMETIEQELDKLDRVRAIGLPQDLFAPVDSNGGIHCGARADCLRDFS
jgi:hypothetical protein